MVARDAIAALVERHQLGPLVWSIAACAYGDVSGCTGDEDDCACGWHVAKREAASQQAAFNDGRLAEWLAEHGR